MALGSDNAICTAELLDALRAVSGAVVDSDTVRPSVVALGTGVHRIATIRADVESTAATAAWIAGIQAWAAAMQQWRTAVTAAFTAWTPSTPADVALRQAILAAPAPPALPAAAPAPPLARIR